MQKLVGKNTNNTKNSKILKIPIMQKLYIVRLTIWDKIKKSEVMGGGKPSTEKKKTQNA